MRLDGHPQRGEHYETTIPQRLQQLRKDSGYATDSSLKMLGLWTALALALLLCWRLVRQRIQDHRLRKQREESRRERRLIRERLAGRNPGLLSYRDPDDREDFREAHSWRVRLIKPGTRLCLLQGEVGGRCVEAEALEMRGRRLVAAMADPETGPVAGWVTHVAFEDEDESWLLLPTIAEEGTRPGEVLLAPPENEDGVRLDAHALFQAALLARAANLDEDGGRHDVRPVTVTGLGLRQATLIDERDWEPDRAQALELGLPGEDEAVVVRARALPTLSDGNQEVRVLLLEKGREPLARLLRWIAAEHGHQSAPRDAPETAPVA